jgi:hypothetical protein
MKTYRTSELIYKACPLHTQCIGSKSKFKKKDNSIYKTLYDKNYRKLGEHKAYHRRLIKRRSATVEPVPGMLINYHNMGLNLTFSPTKNLPF